MSTFAVKVERIVDVQPHPNADRLDLVQVLDWRCVTQKGSFQKGDLCVYFPIDSILPEKVESAVFGPDSKVNLTKSRVKTIKLRGAISQGLVVSLRTIGPLISYAGVGEGTDLTEKLGVTKHEPPEPPANMAGVKGKRSSRQSNPHFQKYTSLENIKNHPDVFEEGEIVYVTEKIHGTNFRAGYVPTVCNTFLKRIKKFFGLLPAYEFVFGSHNVQYQDKKVYRGFYESNVYAAAVEKYQLKTRLLPGEVVYGEIYGPGIQKGYTYNLPDGEHRLALFDVMKDNGYLDPRGFINWCNVRRFEHVPIVGVGGFSKSWVTMLATGDSLLAPKLIREGAVVKPEYNTVDHMIGRKVLKIINPEYLLRDQTDFH